MAKLNIVVEGDSVLRGKCRPVEEITPRIKTLIDDMVETMRDANGVGLAAPQVGIRRRIVVVECEDGEVYEMINPEIIDRKGTQNELEGCLSVPGKYGYTVRPMEVTVKYTDRDGNEKTASGTGLKARAFCHELDHLDGILYIDHAQMVDPEDIEVE